MLLNVLLMTMMMLLIERSECDVAQSIVDGNDDVADRNIRV